MMLNIQSIQRSEISNSTGKFSLMYLTNVSSLKAKIYFGGRPNFLAYITKSIVKKFWIRFQTFQKVFFGFLTQTWIFWNSFNTIKYLIHENWMKAVTSESYEDICTNLRHNLSLIRSGNQVKFLCCTHLMLIIFGTLFATGVDARGMLGGRASH